MKSRLLCLAGAVLLPICLGCPQPTPTNQKLDAKAGNKAEMTVQEQDQAALAPGDQEQIVSQKQAPVEVPAEPLKKPTQEMDLSPAQK